MLLEVYGQSIELFKELEINGFIVLLHHVEGDPVSVRRLCIKSPGGLDVELTPSKGLSLRDCFYRNRQMFWDSPMSHLPDPEAVNLMSTVICDGDPVPGSGWIKYFASHVEMLGLKNWGMGRTLPDGSRYSLHGNVSNIPVSSLEIDTVEGDLHIKGCFDVYGADEIFPHPGMKPDFRVEKKVVIPPDEPAVYLYDSITNLSKENQIPDWGYHLQLKPEEGCQLLFPYGQVKERSGAAAPPDHNFWSSARVSSQREERGYVYRKLKKESCYKDGSEGVRVLLKYIDKPGIEVIIPYAPYTMGWFSCGGGKGDDFLIPSENPEGQAERMLEKNWDGVGPEIGASDLDHGNNIDKDAVVKSLRPGETLVLPLELRFLDQKKTDLQEKSILECINSLED